MGEPQAIKISTDVPLRHVLIDFVDDCLSHYALVADYWQRENVNEIFTRKSEEMRRARLKSMEFNINTVFYMKLLNPMFIAMYIVANARRVIDGDITIGAFIGTTSVI